MRRTQHSWILELLLPFLALSSFRNCCSIGQSTVADTNYANQVIVMLDRQMNTARSAQFLYGMHPGVSTAVQWSDADQEFNVLDMTGNLPIATEDKIPGGQVDKDTMIRVIGQGDSTATIAGLTGTETASRLLTLVQRDTDIGLVSLIGCDLGEMTITGKVTENARQFLREILQGMHDHGVETRVRVPSTLLGISRTGRNMVGYLSKNGVVWTSKGQYNDAFKLEAWLDDKGEMVVDATRGPETAIGPLPLEGIFNMKDGVLVSSINKRFNLEHSSRVGKETLDQSLNNIANSLYDSSEPDNTPEEERVVVRDKRGTYYIRTVRIVTNSQQSFIDELKRQAERYKADPENLAAKQFYYRFGDWVYSLNPTNFYVELVGVVTLGYVPDILGSTDHQLTPIEEKLLPDKHKRLQIADVGDTYPDLKKDFISDDYVDVARLWLTGKSKALEIPAEVNAVREQAAQGKATLSMFLSESIRNFRTHVINVMSLDLYSHRLLSWGELWRRHPMARSGSWEEVIGRRKKVAMEPSGDFLVERQDVNGKATFRQVSSDSPRVRMRDIFGTWISNLKMLTDEGGLLGSLRVAGWPQILEVSVLNDIVTRIHNLVVERMSSPHWQSSDVTRDYPLALSNEKVSERESESVNDDHKYFRDYDDAIRPAIVSASLARDLAFVNGKVQQEVTQFEKDNNRKVGVDVNSIKIEQDGSISFEVAWDGSGELERGRKRLTVKVGREDLGSTSVMKKLRSRIHDITESEEFESVSKGVEAFQVVIGLQSSIKELEEGDIPHGMVDLASSIHDLGDLTGLNDKLESAAKKVLGKVLRPLVDDLTEALPELGSVIEEMGSKVASLAEDVPVVGVAFGIYNIVEDFKAHSVHGYIDAGFDIVLTGLALLGPEDDIISLPLTILKMAFDILFNFHIPKDAPIRVQIVDFFKQLGQNILNFFETFSPIGWIVGAIEGSHKLNSEYHKQQDFLSQLTDYNNYFKIVNSSTVDFTRGIDSQYAGSMTFRLGEDGTTAQLSYVSDIIDGATQYESKQVNFGSSVHDVVLGLGETAKFTTKVQKVKIFFGLITVDSKRIINSQTGDQSSLHGTYYGNDMNNSFYAVQDLPPHYPFSASLYGYELYGLGGNDSFYLGPQRVHAHGGSGADTYFLHINGSNVTIDNYATDGSQDHVILYADFEPTEYTREGNNVVISVMRSMTECDWDEHDIGGSIADSPQACSVGGTVSHRIILEDWFKGSAYQHIDVNTANGYFYKMTSDKDGHPIPAVMAIDLHTRTVGQSFDLQRDFDYCIGVTGSNYADVLIGNGLVNHIMAGLGNDNVTGGGGADMIVIRNGDGVDTLDNYAEDGETDTLFLEVPHELLIISYDGNPYDLVLVSNSSNNTGVVIKNYFYGNEYQHLTVVTSDGLVADMPTDPDARVLTFTYVEHDAELLNLTKKDLLDVQSVYVTNPGASVVGNYLNNIFSAPNGTVSLSGMFGSNTYAVGQNATVYTTNEGKELVVSNMGRFETKCRFSGDCDALKKAGNLSSCDIPCLRSWAANTSIVFQPHNNESEIVVVPRGGLGLSTFDNLLLKSDGILYNFSYDENFYLRRVPIDLDLSSGKMEWPLSDYRYDIIMARTKSVRLVGPPYFVRIRGTSRSEYLDPGPGGCFIDSGGGTDTFVFKPHYGTNNTIARSIHDKAIDTVLFLVPYDGIATAVDNVTNNPFLYSESTGLSVQFATTVDAPLNLLVVSSDGVTAEIHGNRTTGYSLIPKIINRAKEHGEMINLTISSKWDTVISVYGSSKFSNNLIGNNLNNSLVGGERDDTIYGLDGNDALKGGGGRDKLFGGRGDDILLGGSGGDLLSGGDGNDLMFTATLSGGSGQDEIDGGDGTDTVAFVETVVAGCNVSLAEGFVFSVDNPGEILARLTNIENVIGTQSNDTLVGDDHDNRLLGREGHDTLVPMGGSDLLEGGEGNDNYLLLEGTSVVATINNYAEDLANDTITVSHFNDSLDGMCAHGKWLNYTILQRTGDHLAIRWLDLRQPVFYDNKQSPRIILYNWFHGDEYRHVCLHVCNLHYCNELDELSIGLPDHEIVTLGGAREVRNSQVGAQSSSIGVWLSVLSIVVAKLVY